MTPASRPQTVSQAARVRESFLLHRSGTSMSLFQLRAIVALHAGKDLFADNARIKKIMRRKTARWLDQSFFEILAKLEPDNFLECGARAAGASQRFMSSIGKRAVALEANPLTFQQRTQLAERKGVTVLNCGVGPNDDSILEFFMPKDYPTAGNASFMQAAGQDCESRTVKTRTIDSLCREYFPAEQSVALWIDVEGLSLDVLTGAHETLDSGRCVALKIEIETAPLWVDQHLAGEVDDYLRARHYVPLLCDFEYDHQFNVVYVRKDRVDELEYLAHQRLFALSQRRTTLLQKMFKSRNYIWRRRKAR